MTTIAITFSAVAILGLSGLGLLAWLAFTHATQDVDAFGGFQGMHFED